MIVSRFAVARYVSLLGFVIASLGASGCHYAGVGNLAIHDANANSDVGGDASTSAASTNTGTFDRYLSREDGDVYTFTAYQRMKSRQKFGQYYRSYKKDGQFIQAELVVRMNKSGEVVGEPRLLLRQGNRILTDGLLNGELSVTPQGDRLSITGNDLVWQLDENTSRVVSFDLLVFNVLVEPPPKDV